MTLSTNPNGISNVTALRCQACGHEWPEICELPMPAGAWLKRAQRTWCICPKCGNEDKGKGKGIVILTGDLYREAVDKFVAQGRVPVNIQRPWVKNA